jgi:S-DNA-T family DNA segregation ATPase FtsK/SpoIIIE
VNFIIQEITSRSLHLVALIGALIFTNLSNIFGVVGSLIFIVIFFLASISLTFSFSWLSVIDALGHGTKYLHVRASAQINNLFKFLFNALKSIDFSKFKLKDEPMLERSVTEAKPRELNLPQSTQVTAQPETKSQETYKPVSKIDTPKNESAATSTVYKTKDKNVNSEMPSTDLLDRVLDDGSSLTKEQLDEVADRLEIKLQEFGVEAKVVSVIPGPVVTRFEIQPAPGTKASKITNIAQDIARSLAVMSVRVVEVIPGKSVVGIEIPNTNRKMVRLTEILSSDTFHNSTSPLSMALGHDIAGKPIVVDLAKMPHLLVAGTTGSGKSVGLMLCC